MGKRGSPALSTAGRERHRLTLNEVEASVAALDGKVVAQRIRDQAGEAATRRWRIGPGSRERHPGRLNALLGRAPPGALADGLLPARRALGHCPGDAIAGHANQGADAVARATRRSIHDRCLGAAEGGRAARSEAGAGAHALHGLVQAADARSAGVRSAPVGVVTRAWRPDADSLRTGPLDAAVVAGGALGLDGHEAPQRPVLEMGVATGGGLAGWGLDSDPVEAEGQPRIECSHGDHAGGGADCRR
jgi:hypothetical protein